MNGFLFQRNGLEWLDQGLNIQGLRSSLCAITLLVYQVVVAPILGKITCFLVLLKTWNFTNFLRRPEETLTNVEWYELLR